MLTYHGAPRSAWETDSDRDYLPEPFTTDGFIHTSAGAETLAAALNRYLKDDLRPYVALLIDLDRVQACWDVARYAGDAGEYPHIHGPLNRDAVVQVVPIERAADGSFLPPAA